MRPIELSLKDFRSFKGEHRISFAGRRLVAVAGPIGAGKTSILDSIAYALYGQTAKLGRASTALINQEAVELAVRLRFRVGEGTWEVERHSRRRGAGTAALYPYSDSEGRNLLELVSGARNVNARIEEILGMDFAAFSRSILLPQGQFAEFLQATPSEKDRVLKGVFGLERIDRMREVARERAQLVGLEAERIAASLEQAEAASRELAELGPELERSMARAAAIGELQVRIGRLETDRHSVARDLESVTETAKKLRQAAGQLRPRPEVEELVALARAAAEKDRAAAARVDDRRSQMQAAEAELGGFLDGLGGEEGLALTRTVVAELINERRVRFQTGALLQSAAEALEIAAVAERQLGSEHANAVADVDCRFRDLDGARADYRAARMRVTELERADMAHALRGHLSAGDDCPVCGRQIGELPETCPHPDLDDARETAENAAAEMDRARDALAKARERVAGLTVQLSSARGRVEAAAAEKADAETKAESAKKRLAAAAERAARQLGGEDPADSLAELEERLAVLRRDAEDARTRFTNAVDAETGTRARGQDARWRARSLVTELSGIAGQMGALEALADIPEGDVAAMAARLRGFVDARDRELEEQVAQLNRRVKGLDRNRAQLLTEWEVPVDADVNRFAAQVHAEAATLRARENELKARTAKAADLARHKRAADRRHRHLQRLVEDLRDSRFLKYMLAGKRAQLAELGGLRIRELTGDRFGFSPGDQFEIVDYGAADAELRVRSADTLSGGETFLASLSLALALADLVAGEGGRLGSFFLDEGFGSLDADHLSVAMDGIERLASETEDRLVVVVSHVPGVRERVEDQIVLGNPADPGEGSRVLTGAAPA